MPELAVGRASTNLLASLCCLGPSAQFSLLEGHLRISDTTYSILSKTMSHMSGIHCQQTADNSWSIFFLKILSPSKLLVSRGGCLWHPLNDLLVCPFWCHYFPQVPGNLFLVSYIASITSFPYGKTGQPLYHWPLLSGSYYDAWHRIFRSTPTVGERTQWKGQGTHRLMPLSKVLNQHAAPHHSPFL